MKRTILPSEIMLRFHPSRFLWGWWLLFSIAVLICLWLCLPVAWASGLTCLYAIACGWQWTQLLATRWRFSVQALRVDVFGQMSVSNALGQRWHVQVLPDSMVHYGCLVLHIAYLELHTAAATDHGNEVTSWIWRCLRPTRLLVLFDHTDAASQRALRVWLKWGLRE